MSQVELLQAFPHMQWQQIQRRYAYYFGDGNFIDHYHGEVSYGHKATWYDTEEYKAEHAAQKSVRFHPHHRMKSQLVFNTDWRISDKSSKNVA